MPYTLPPALSSRILCRRLCLSWQISEVFIVLHRSRDFKLFYLRRPRIAVPAHAILYEDIQRRLKTGDFKRLHLDHITQPALECSLQGKLQGRCQFWTIGVEDQLPYTAAKIGPVNPLTRIGEQQLIDHLLNMLIIVNSGGMTTAVKLDWKVNVHHVPSTRTCVVMIFSGVAVGAQIAWLSSRSTGIPPAWTRVAALTH